MNRFEVRVAQALTKQRPVLLISHQEACEAQETVIAVPIRTMPPPFQCHGLLAISTLTDAGDLHGYVRCDLPLYYKREQIGKLIHRFVNHRDVEKIENALRDAFGILTI